MIQGTRGEKHNKMSAQEELVSDSHHKTDDKPEEKQSATGAKCGCNVELGKMLARAFYIMSEAKGLKEECYKDPPEEYEKQNYHLAKAALAYFNENQDAKFELVNPIRSNAIGEEHHLNDWFHVNFEACDFNSPDPSTKLFFAELLLDKNKSVERVNTDGVKTCKIVTPSAPGVAKGCGYCYRIYHPVGGYEVGVVPEGGRRLRPSCECHDELLDPDDIIFV